MNGDAIRSFFTRGLETAGEITQSETVQCEIWVEIAAQLAEIRVQLTEANTNGVGVVLQLSLLNEKLIDLMSALGADPAEEAHQERVAEAHGARNPIGFDKLKATLKG
jgi:hypothetical protein